MLAPSFFTAPVCALAVLLGAWSAAAQSVRISNLADVTIPRWVVGDPDIIQDVFVCVYRETASSLDLGNYSVTATGDGPGFFLRSGPNLLAYNVTWSDGGAGNPGGGSTVPVINNVKLANRKNARNQAALPTGSNDCSAGSSPTARLRISIFKANLDAARDGMFTGVLSLLISPT